MNITLYCHEEGAKIAFESIQDHLSNQFNILGISDLKYDKLSDYQKQALAKLCHTIIFDFYLKSKIDEIDITEFDEN